MKNLIFTLLMLSVHSVFSQPLTFLTYNIRYGLADDGENRWELRKDGLAKQLKFYEPDVFGIQEGLDFQVEFLDSALDEYSYYGVGRDDGTDKGEFSAIYYNKEKFKPLKKSTFWLSETPEKPSKGWDAALPRICTVVLMERKDTRQKFWVFNTHFDHIGVEARKQSARLIVDKINEFNAGNYPVVLMGDFNLEPDSEAIQFISQHLNDSKLVSQKVAFGPDGTFNAFKFHEIPERRIDFIFTDKNSIEVLKYAVLSDSKNLKYYSDHLPVYVELRMKRR